MSPGWSLVSLTRHRGSTTAKPVTMLSAPTVVPDVPIVVTPALTLGPNHTVHVLYYNLGDDAREYHGLEGPPWEGTWSLVASSSRDGGRQCDPGSMVDPANVHNDVYYTSSADGGRTFSSNIKLNRLSSNPRSGIRYLLAYAGTRVEFGVRLAITSWDDAALAAWTDSRYTIESDISVNSGPTEHDVYAARINIANR